MAKASPSHPNKGSVAPMPPASDTGFEHLRSLPMGGSVETETRRKMSEPSNRAIPAAKPEPSQAQSAIAARIAQPPTIAVRGGCSSPARGSGGAGEGKVPAVLAPRKGGQLYTPPKDLVFLYPPATLPSLIVSSMLVPTVRRPLKGVPTFVLSCIVQGGLVAYLVSSVMGRWEHSSTCDSEALAQFFAIFVFTTALWDHHSSGTVLQLCLYSRLLKVDGAPAPEPNGIMRYTPDEYREVRPTSLRRRWLIALVPMTDMLLELAVWIAGCLFLVMSESTEDLIVNSVAVNFIGEVDLLLLSCFFSKASRQRLAKYRIDHRWGVAEGVTHKDKMTPGTLG